MSEKKSYRIVLLGAPGAGKGTQAKMLAEALDIPHISSGDLFRDNLSRETALGLEAKAYMDRGELVPDEVTIRMVAERLGRPDAAEGFLLDGFPRTVPQAQALDEALADMGQALDVVPLVQVSDAVALARLGGRWTCRQCGAMYHTLFDPPKAAGICDKCGGELYQRADDTPETHRRRLEVYAEQTAPLIDFYRQKGLLVEVNGEQEIGGVQADLRAVVEEAAL